MNPEEIAEVSKALESHGIWPENTRIKKIWTLENITYEVLQASVEAGTGEQIFKLPSFHATIHLKRGDHCVELTNICDSLSKATLYAANETQKSYLQKYIESFQTGNLDSYRESLRAWVTDKGARVENIFGFVEPYRDPCGIRAEFEGLVGIADSEETKLLTKLVQASDIFIKRLPWVRADHEGMGPFEKQLFEPPDLFCLHGRFRQKGDLSKVEADYSSTRVLLKYRISWNQSPKCNHQTLLSTSIH
jgi:dipeptidyl-peptidase III